ncbi:hypothetical protein ASE71_32485 [Ensifer sp. Root954]|nr:hypothetical protein ASD49_31280 [Ensifer sp. Root1298]KQX85214.1 hypothetical protein ASD41_31085 [Ensifer sp. Root1312]KRC21331.1 hypothetical protein ASE29_30760 [Ensifer sp. Root74]KRD60927.1 hypothetical protein ASE71_32485 [Ensifer sp. Root954]
MRRVSTTFHICLGRLEQDVLLGVAGVFLGGALSRLIDLDIVGRLQAVEDGLIENDTKRAAIGRRTGIVPDPAAPGDFRMHRRPCDVDVVRARAHSGPRCIERRVVVVGLRQGT